MHGRILVCLWLGRVDKRKDVFGTLKRNKCRLKTPGPLRGWPGVRTDESAYFASDALCVHRVSAERGANPELRPLWSLSGESGSVWSLRQGPG